MKVLEPKVSEIPFEKNIKLNRYSCMQTIRNAIYDQRSESIVKSRSPLKKERIDHCNNYRKPLPPRLVQVLK